MLSEYTFEQTGSIITDYGDGRAKLVFGRPGISLDEIIDQAHWADKTFRNIFQQRGKKKFNILVDLQKLDKITLNDKVRAVYKDIIESSYTDKIAVVGDGFNYTKVLTIMLLLRKKEHVRFFFNMKEAQDWLDW